MDRYYYLDITLIHLDDESKNKVIEAVAINKHHESVYFPIIAMRRAIFNGLSQIEVNLNPNKYSMRVDYCQEIDFSEYQYALKIKMNKIVLT